MYCSNCGNYNSDDAEFCQNCGQRLRPSEQTEEIAPPAQEIPAFTPAAQPQSRREVFYPILLKFASSKLFLAGIILFGISILFGIVGSIVTAATPWEDIINRLPEMLQPGLVQFAKNSGVSGASVIPCGYPTPGIPGSAGAGIFTVSAAVGSIIGMIPAILIFAGMLMTRSAAVKSAQSRSLMRTSGLSLVKGVHIYILVITCLAAAIMLLVLVLALIFMPVIGSMVTDTDTFPMTVGISPAAPLNIHTAASGLPENFNSAILIVLIAALIIFIGVFVFQIVYLAKVVGMLSKIKKFAAGGAPYMRPSMFVIVIGFIGAGFGLLSALGTLIISPFAFAAGITGALANIFLLTVLCQYRNEMKRVSLMQSAQPLSF